MNFVIKHLIGGVAFLAGLIILAIGLFTDGGTTTAWTGGILAICGVVFMAFNMINTMNGVQRSFKNRSNRSFGDFGDFDD